MIAHPAVRRVNFTGSTHVGRIIAGVCAQHLKQSVLELGGKAPMLVLDDANIEAAVDGAIFGAFANSGQICMSTERFVVDQTVADAFVAKLAERAQALPLGDPRKGPVVLGSVVGMSTVERCNALIDDALAKGAKLVCGGKADSTLMPATLLDHVTADMRIYSEETFGPVKAIVRVDGEDAAIACANDNPFRPVFGRVHRRCRSRLARGPAHRGGHLPCQRPHGARRSPDAVRRRQGQRLGALWRPRRYRRVHRIALDHRADHRPPLPVLSPFPSPLPDFPLFDNPLRRQTCKYQTINPTAATCWAPRVRPA